MVYAGKAKQSGGEAIQSRSSSRGMRTLSGSRKLNWTYNPGRKKIHKDPLYAVWAHQEKKKSGGHEERGSGASFITWRHLDK